MTMCEYCEELRGPVGVDIHLCEPRYLINEATITARQP